MPRVQQQPNRTGISNLYGPCFPLGGNNQQKGKWAKQAEEEDQFRIINGDIDIKNTESG